MTRLASSVRWQFSLCGQSDDLGDSLAPYNLYPNRKTLRHLEGLKVCTQNIRPTSLIQLKPLRMTSEIVNSPASVNDDFYENQNKNTWKQ